MTAPRGTAAAAAASVRAFLDASHVELFSRLAEYAHRDLAPRPEPLTDDAARREARTLVGELGAAGWYAPIVTGDLRALCLTREVIAAANPLADAVMALQALGGLPLLLAGTDRQRARWLPEIVAGRVMTAFAMTEPRAGSDVGGIGTVARHDSSTWVLDGEKHLISNAGLADLYVLFAKTDPAAGARGITAFLVPAGTRGLTFTHPQMMAAPHPLGRLELVECRVPADAVVGDVNGGFKLGMTTLDLLRPGVGAAACGMAARALDEAVAHARSRQLFGQALADFQIVREKIGRMATDLDAARLLVYRAAWERDRGTARITVEAAMAKGFATEAAQRIVDEAVQMVGGVGLLIGHPVERLYRTVRALRIYEGATEVQRLVVAGGLLTRD